ncbi:metallophosphoesterase [Leptospira sp. GIMC2001]|uniref:metallophosphoesterase n=1 Tax=Leptospira sp. GIMC2001 TaxID=1513297 RepID=UPI00234B461D|nr:metallophosphoesterase [Leptospira sp. GIMC2001]WCL50765.1 hypothetical protein O4O04_08115 [Leptospira sp. GIMC2001]
MNQIKNKIYKNNIPFIAIGDLHDRYDLLQKLILRINKCNLLDYRIVFLGDYFGGTRDFGYLLKEIYKLREESDFIIGNHDLEFINLWNLVNSSIEKKMKLLEYFQLEEEIVQWFLSSLVSSVETPKVFLSHAGIDDLKKLEDQTLTDLTTSCYRANLDHVTEKLIIQGHLPMDEVTIEGNHIFVDTGCGYGGYLSAYIYPDGINITSKTELGAYQHEYN